MPALDARAVLDAAAGPLLAADERERIVYANPAAERLFGWPAGGLAGQPLDALLPEPARGRGPFRDLAARAEPARVRALRRDGVEVEVIVSARNAGPLLVATIGSIGEPRPSPDERYRLVFDNAPIGILHFEAQGIVTDCNAAMAQILGYARDAIVGVNLLTLHGDPSRDKVASLAAGALEGRSARFEGQYTSTAQKSTYLEALLAPLQGPSGVVGGVVIAEDVTERKRIEAALARAERLASIGTLAAGVAHEINNPLVYVTLGLELIDRDLQKFRSAPRPPGDADWDEVRTLCADALHGAERVRSIVRDLHTFSRGDGQRPVPVDVQKVLDSSINVAMSHIRPRAHLVRDYQPVGAVLGDESRLGQVFLNLLVNAAQAIPEGAPEKNSIVARTRTGPSGERIVEVEDTGVGIEPAKMKSIFEPFWTDKPVGVGTGLGLFIVHGIVTAMGGDIQVRSEPGRGSTFRVTFLSAAGETAQGQVPAPAPPLQRGPHPRVLLIDDEAHLGVTLSVGLRGQAEVVAVRSGREGVRLLLGEGGFDLILCDLMMPDVTGMDVFEQVVRERPALGPRFVFMSGGAATERARRFLEQNPGQRLDKPFRLEQVEALLRQQATS